jgi:hypothetical protein
MADERIYKSYNSLINVSDWEENEDDEKEISSSPPSESPQEISGPGPSGASSGNERESLGTGWFHLPTYEIVYNTNDRGEREYFVKGETQQKTRQGKLIILQRFFFCFAQCFLPKLSVLTARIFTII